VGLVYANGEKNEANQVNEHSMVKNPKWQETDQLAIDKRG